MACPLNCWPRLSIGVADTNITNGNWRRRIVERYILSGDPEMLDLGCEESLVVGILDWDETNVIVETSTRIVKCS